MQAFAALIISTSRFIGIGQATSFIPKRSTQILVVDTLIMIRRSGAAGSTFQR